MRHARCVPNGKSIQPESFYFQRFNANGVNLNRNFPDYFQDFENVIQPETQAVIDWMEKQQFVISASLHGGALLVNYAYDNYYAAPGGKCTYPNEHETFGQWCLTL